MCVQVVGLGGTAPPAALIHAPLSLLPVAFPASRFQQVGVLALCSLVHSGALQRLFDLVHA